MKLTRAELAILQALDFACWEASDAGGDGWVLIRSVAAARGVGYNWASQVVRRLALRGLAEERLSSQIHWNGRRRKQYALSEAGSSYLLGLDAPQSAPATFDPADPTRRGER